MDITLLILIISVAANIILGVFFFLGWKMVEAQRDLLTSTKQLNAALDASNKAEKAYSRNLEGIIAKDYGNASLKLLQESVGRGTPEHLKPQSFPSDRGWR